MRTRLAHALAAMLVALAVAPDAAVANGEVRFEGGVFLGVDYFGDNIELGNSFFDEQIPGTAAMFGVRAAVGFMQRFSLELEGKLAPTSTDGEPAVTVSVLGLRGHAVYTMFPDAALRPFVLIGGGIETMLADEAPAEAALTDPDTDPAFHWGVGARWALGDGRYGLRLDLRNGLTAGRDPDVAATFAATMGIFIELGGELQVAEKTIIVEKPVPAPVQPAGPVDSDGDGIPDDVDRCPGQAELINQIDDDDGCPETDSDGDGLIGTRDMCPEAAEDVDGYEDVDGCPDPDNDDDGRPDPIDQCPMEAENLNGFEDGDGCPDELPEKVQRFTGVIQGINFRTGSAQIQRSSNRILDQAVALFEEYPDLRIEISGHTDDTGTYEINVSLSRERADSVKWYLVDKGVDENRIITVGHGPNKPIGDNTTRSGRALNRRIEFQLLPGPYQVELDAQGNPIDPTPAE